MKTILFSTDFTESATTALDWAKLFARQYEATLVLLHVQQIPVADGRFGYRYVGTRTRCEHGR